MLSPSKDPPCQRRGRKHSSLVLVGQALCEVFYVHGFLEFSPGWALWDRHHCPLLIYHSSLCILLLKLSMPLFLHMGNEKNNLQHCHEAKRYSPVLHCSITTRSWWELLTGEQFTQLTLLLLPLMGTHRKILSLSFFKKFFPSVLWISEQDSEGWPGWYLTK